MKPILFNTEMVRAILEGRKTVTRRVVKFMFPEDADDFQIERYAKDDSLSSLLVCKNGKPSRAYEVPQCPGDILYVRETWYYELHMEDMTVSEPDLPSGRYSHRYIFKVDCPDYPVNVGVGQQGWSPSIHMPREAARLFLRVTDVRVERLQEITDDELVCDFGVCQEAIQAVGCDALIISLWDNTIEKTADRALYSWAPIPWVWVIAFERCKKPERGTDDG